MPGRSGRTYECLFGTVRAHFAWEVSCWEVPGAATGKARYRRKRLCPRRAEEGLGDPIRKEGRLEERDEGIGQTGRQKDLHPVQLLSVLVSAVVTGGAVLVFRSVWRSMLMPKFAIGSVIVSGSLGQRFMMHISITQLPDHRLR